ncbi:DUF2812 domain-containing protein [Oscillibacter sp.]|uniref:DUF2812 domain-containing protein n=1 Tax=Oscillospiraceae TaxID=216572 RepID=UPI00260A3B29|nr:DUF2812 domain-containing protein [Oscillibacter sp.]MBS6353855.1 DUF2812 domain-containing protein [Oscillibacter sp.]
MKKRFLMPEAYWDAALLERWLEEKAVQGWRPVSFSRYGSGKFESAEPRKLRYRLEPLRTETYDAQCEREETYREMGWEPAGVLGDYRVYACADPQAPELFTDPSALRLTWEDQLRRFRRHRLISILLIVVWTILQFRSLWESGRPVEVFLRGMWAVWLLAVVCALEWLHGNLRALRGVQRLRRQLEAGMAPDTENLDESLRRRRRQNVVSWGICGLVAVLAVSVIGSQREMPLSDAPEPLPYVAMEVLAPEEAALPLDSSLYRERRSLLTDHREISQFRWNFEASLWAEFDRVRLPILAEALYRERLANFLDAWPEMAVREVTDSRFDRAVVIDAGENQCFIGRMGRAVLMERVRTDRNLMDHLDDFAAVLAELQ